MRIKREDFQINFIIKVSSIFYDLRDKSLIIFYKNSKIKKSEFEIW
jgi:hypothetical protein